MVLARYYREFLSYCQRMVKNRDIAADLAQESCARVLAMQQSGQTVLDPAALLRQVALRAKIDLDRRAKIRQHEDIDALEESQAPRAPRHLQPEEAYAAAQVFDAYAQAMNLLPPRCREAFAMHTFDDLPHKEIAQRMGISVSMVKQYVSRGKAACLACRQSLDLSARRTPQDPR